MTEIIVENKKSPATRAVVSSATNLLVLNVVRIVPPRQSEKILVRKVHIGTNKILLEWLKR